MRAGSQSYNKSRHRPYNKNLRRINDEDAIPGVQKLKSALRQTKRLLAKDNLAANIRVETERRLKALEADLTRAERSRKERHYTAKYHKVKFFERQKVLRKINQTKRRIETARGKEKEALTSALLDLRVDLNYILHFPRTQKYVSLFPPEVRGSSSTATTVIASSDDNDARSSIRESIRQKMGRGELGAEPDNELGKSGRRDKQIAPGRKGTSTGSLVDPDHSDGVSDDDFFGDDDEEDSQQSGVSDS